MEFKIYILLILLPNVLPPSTPFKNNAYLSTKSEVSPCGLNDIDNFSLSKNAKQNTKSKILSLADYTNQKKQLPITTYIQIYRHPSNASSQKMDNLLTNKNKIQLLNRPRELNKSVITDETRKKLLEMSQKAYVLIKNVVNLNSPFYDGKFFGIIGIKIDDKIKFIENANAIAFTDEQIKQLRYLMEWILMFIEKSLERTPSFFAKCGKIWKEKVSNLKGINEKYKAFIKSKAVHLYEIDKNCKYMFGEQHCLNNDIFS